MPRLFTSFERTDPSPAAWSEDSFAFLNRVSGTFWGRIREELERWYEDYCGQAEAEKAADLRARFRRRDARQHVPAWWELYVYRLLRCIYPEADVLPEQELVGASTRPDFCIVSKESGEALLYVEAAAPFSGPAAEEGRHGAREAVVLDAIDELASEDFFVHVDFQRAGEEQPRKRQVQAPLRAWLAQLRPAEVLAAYERDGTVPQLRIEARGWVIEAAALPKKPNRRGNPAHRLIGVGPATAGWANDVAAIKETLGHKAGHYGLLQAPFVIAVLPSSWTFDSETAGEILYGSEAVEFVGEAAQDARPARSRDGFWAAASATRVSAVLFGLNVWPWTVPRLWPTLWLNPIADHPLEADALPMPSLALAGDGRLRRKDAAEVPAVTFGLDPDWPGPELPFPRSRS